MNVLPSFDSTLAPHTCLYCTGTQGPAIDLQRENDDNPNAIIFLYLCRDCALHIARLMAPECGLTLTADDVLAKYEAALAAAADALNEALAERDRALAARDALVVSYGREPAEPAPESEPPAKRASPRKQGATSGSVSA